MKTITPGDPDFGTPDISPSWVAKALLVMFFGTVLSVGAISILVISFAWGTGQTTKNLGPAETKRRVSQVLFRWDLCKRETYHELQYRKNGTVAVDSQLTREIAGLDGIRGFTESGGLHGDGTDYHEASITAELLKSFQGKWASSPAIPVALPPGVGKYAPGWWPKRWPPDATFYEHQATHLILSPSLGRAWVYVWRS